MYDNIIVIPFRDRETQLQYFIKHSVPVIQKHLPNSTIVVVEQDDKKPFNRGALLNVAFAEYSLDTDNFITHDVDINPRKEIMKYYRNPLKTDYVRAILSPELCLGAIVKIQSNTICNINGFPNHHWGWGAEDKALQNRCEFYGVKRESILTHHDKTRDDQYFKCFDEYERIKHDFNCKYWYNFHVWNQMTDVMKKEDIDAEGINTLEYDITEKIFIHPLVELIKVKIKISP